MKQIEASLERLSKTFESISIPKDPVVVLGMHRSGTTMLTNVLLQAGVFMGTRLSGNMESRVFQDANRQIFDYFNASWLDGYLLPKPDIFCNSFSGLAAGIADRLSEDLRTAFFDTAPLGCRLWGFKDPRTSVTAGLFLRLFPDARAIFIYRNPLDVALSIVTRERKKKRKHLGMKTFEYTSEEFQALLMRSIKSWETTNERVLEVLPLFSRYSVVKYETVVVDPAATLIPSLAAIGVLITREQIGDTHIRTEQVRSASSVGTDCPQLSAYLMHSDVLTRLNKYPEMT